MTSESDDEPRKIPLRIRLPFVTDDEFISRYGANVTRGGIFIATKNGKPEGTALSFELVLQDGTRLMRGEGVVQRLLSEELPGMVVRFTRIDTRTKGLIDLIIERREGLSAAEPPLQSTALPVPSAPRPPRPRVVEAPAPKAPLALADDVVLGIDLGTTTCRAAVVIEGEAKLIPIASERGAFALPSVVAYDADKARVLLGRAARRHRLEHPAHAVSGFKRLMGRRARSQKARELAQSSLFVLAPDVQGDVGIDIAGRVFSISEFAAHLLKELKNAAQDALGREITRAVLCVPAWYTDHQREAILNAGHLAGLDVVSILNEPTAIALAFGYGRGLARKRVLVYDLGGGTFDASVLEITGDDLEAISTGGDNFLGGQDFDARLADALIGTLAEAPRAALLASPMTIERVRDAAEVAKIALSDQMRAPVHVPFVATDENENPVDLKVEVERAFLESTTLDLVQRTGEVTRAVLDAARLSPENLDEVLFVGGQTRAPAVRQHLESILGRPGRTDIDPAGAVALGAAIWGHSLVQKERGKRSSSLAEVLSSPIGVAVQGGGFRRILERNTRLPAEKSLTLAVESQQVLKLAVMQGTSTRAEENEYLGALTLRAERTGELMVHFAVAADGRLSLSATTPTGKRAEAHFATSEASEAVQQQLLAQSPLPDDSGAVQSRQSGLFGGLKRLFGSK